VRNTAKCYHGASGDPEGYKVTLQRAAWQSIEPLRCLYHLVGSYVSAFGISLYRRGLFAPQDFRSWRKITISDL